MVEIGVGVFYVSYSLTSKLTKNEKKTGEG